MDANDREWLRALLLSERDRTAEALHRLETEEAEAQSVSGGDVVRTQWTPGDAASDVQEEEADFFLAGRASAHLAELDDALRLLAREPDALGRCEVCGGEIASERLRLIPWSRRCSRCVRRP